MEVGAVEYNFERRQYLPSLV